MGRKVLIVEDERDVAFLLEYNLKRAGYSVTSCGSAEDALAFLKTKKADLILLDIMLPKMDGLECCRVIRQESDVPILFVTARAGENDRILGYKSGANGYIKKPFSLGPLLARIRSILLEKDVAAVAI